MNAVIKEEIRVENTKKTYLEMYKEYINGYLHYKLEKAHSARGTDQAERNEK